MIAEKSGGKIIIAQRHMMFTGVETCSPDQLV